MFTEKEKWKKWKCLSLLTSYISHSSAVQLEKCKRGKLVANNEENQFLVIPDLRRLSFNSSPATGHTQVNPNFSLAGHTQVNPNYLGNSDSSCKMTLKTRLFRGCINYYILYHIYNKHKNTFKKNKDTVFYKVLSQIFYSPIEMSLKC